MNAIVPGKAHRGEEATTVADSIHRLMMMSRNP
jgi:hypothetical protein